MVRKTSLTDKYKCSTVAVFRPYAYSDSHRAFLFISVRCAPTKSVCASAKCFPSKIFGQRRRRRRDAGLSSNICADHSSAWMYVCVCLCVSSAHPSGRSITHERQTKRQTPILMWNTVDLMILSGADAVYISVPTGAVFDDFYTNTATQLSLLRVHTRRQEWPTQLLMNKTHTHKRSDGNGDLCISNIFT